MSVLYALVSILGSISLAIYGTKLIGDSLQKVTHNTIGHFFEFVGDSRIMAIFTGFFVTTLVQSSLDVVTMVFSFVNSGLLYVSQALGVIIGADIGSTLGGWVISMLVLNSTALSHYTLGFMACGLLLILFNKNKSMNILGEFTFGVGFLLLGLDFLLNHLGRHFDLIQSFRFYQESVYFPFLIFITGIFLTLVLRSAGTSIIVVMSFLFTNFLSLSQAMIMVLGINLGMIIRPFLSGLQMGNALTKKVALLYASLKLLSITIWIIFFKNIYGYFEHFFLNSLGNVVVLALYDTILSLFTSLLFPPFNLFYECLGSNFSKKSDLFRHSHSPYRLEYDKRVVAEVPELSLAMAKKEIVHMTGLIEEMAYDYQHVFNNPGEKLRKMVYGIRDKEERTDEMYIEITRFLVESSNSDLLAKHHENVNFFVRIVKELESAGDCIARLSKLCRHRYKARVDYGKEAQEELNNYFNLALDFFKSIKNKLSLSVQSEDFDQITYIENCMNQERTRLRLKSQKNLEKGLVNVKAEIMFMEHVRHIERLGDCCMNLAEAIRNLK